MSSERGQVHHPPLVCSVTTGLLHLRQTLFLCTSLLVVGGWLPSCNPTPPPQTLRWSRVVILPLSQHLRKSGWWLFAPQTTTTLFTRTLILTVDTHTPYAFCRQSSDVLLHHCICPLLSPWVASKHMYIGHATVSSDLSLLFMRQGASDWHACAICGHSRRAPVRHFYLASPHLLEF